MYGLHQRGRLWFYELNSILLKLKFKKLETCNCVYFRENNVVLLVYVEDMVIFSKTQSLAERTIDLIKTEFEYTSDSVLIHQSTYIKEVFDRFKDFHPPISSLPISKGIQYSKSDCPNSNEDSEALAKFPHRNVLGCLSFIPSRIRPDISNAVNIFSQFQESPGTTHWMVYSDYLDTPIIPLS